jgi:hypothetical protein
MSLGDPALRAWCAAESALRSRMSQRGQGTVEYLGLALAVGVLLVAVSKAFTGKDHGIGEALSKALKSAMSTALGDSAGE